jgi:hypothetical protein
VSGKLGVNQKCWCGKRECRTCCRRVYMRNYRATQKRMFQMREEIACLEVVERSKPGPPRSVMSTLDPRADFTCRKR